MADKKEKEWGKRNKNILKTFDKIGTGELPNVEFKRKNPDTGKMETLTAPQIYEVKKSEDEGRLIRKTSKMREGGFTKRGGMYKKGYVYSDD